MDGGIRMNDVKNYIKACKAVWTNKFLNTDDSNWKLPYLVRSSGYLATPA